MNLLIVSDKADVKLYETVAKTAPNTTVLGAVTKIDPDFISLLKDRYNPHAIMIDTDVAVKDSDIRTTIEQISQEYPYMKVLVLTGAEDSYDYPASCVVQGQVSNIKLKEILQKLSDGAPAIDYDSDSGDDSEERLPRRITFDSLTVDKLSTSGKKKRKPFARGLRFNPIMLSGIAAGVLVLFVVVLMIIKSGSQQGLTSSPDEPVTAVLSETTVSASIAEVTTTAAEYPTYPAVYYTTEPVETTVQPRTIAPEPTRAEQEYKPVEQPEVSPATAAPAQSGGSSSGGSGSGGSSSGSGGNSGGNSGGGSSGNSSQGGQTTTQVYGGDPVVSYDNNGRYANQSGNAVTGVKLSYNAKTLEVGDTLKLTASVSPANANQSVTWSSSDSFVVSVSNGQLTAKKVGTATVTARANNGVSASCSVTVKSKKQTETVYLSAKEYNTGVGRTITVTLYGASNVTWSVSNSNPVRITPDDNKVKVYAVRNGTTQLYGRDNSTKKVYICEIHVT